MGKCYIFTEEELTALANSIRIKAGTEEKMTMAEMALAIRELESAAVAKYGVTDTYDFANQTGTGLIAQYCKLFIRYIGYHITNIPYQGFYRNSLTEFDFPLLEIMNEGAFQECTSLVNVDIPSTVTTIGPSVFRGCTALKKVKFKNAITALSNYLFYGCTNLEEIEVPSGITSIGQSAFYNCSEFNIDALPSGLLTIGASAFQGCTKLSITSIPDSVTTIEGGAFQRCTDIEIDELPESLISFGSNVFANSPKVTIHEMNNDDWIVLPNYAFAYCTGITRFTLPSALTAIPQYCFDHCSNLQSIVIPALVTTINQYAFQYSGLINLVIPSNITTIGQYAFAYCPDLETVTIGSGVTTLSNNYIFRGCTALKKVFFKGTPSSIASGTFNSDRTITDIYVPWASGAVSGAPWGATKATIHYNTVYNQNLTAISVDDSEIDYRVGRTSQLTVSYSPDEALIDPTQLGVTYTITSGSEYASVDQNGLVTITNEMAVGDTITITIVSTYDSTITDTCTITAIAPYFTVDTNNGQWVDSGETIDGRTVYKSDAGSYHVNNGLSRMTVTIRGYDEFRVLIRSYAESGYDYAEIGALDAVNISRSSSANVYKTVIQSASEYGEYTFTNIDGDTHTFEVIFSKDGSGNSNDDRAYVYFNPETNILNGLTLTGDSQMFGTVGTTSQISLAYDPSYCDEGVKGVTWSVTTNNASVDQNGLVTLTSALNAGDVVTVRATSTYDNTIYADHSITIKAGTFGLIIDDGGDSTITLVPPTSESDIPSVTKQFGIIYDPTTLDPSKQGVSWSVVDSTWAGTGESVNITIDSTGLLTVSGYGMGHYDGYTIVIRATSTYDSTVYTEETIMVWGF